MNTVKTVRELRAAVARARSEGKRIGFVPTMGNLHAGHAALVKKAGERADFVVVSIFVNPLQFGPSEDLDTYPRTLAADQERLLEAGCHLLFTPTVEEMYPDGMDGQTRIHVPGVSEGLCGASRPGHFEGVATVVSKLLNMVQPDLALFGEKDFQQLAVIRKLIRKLVTFLVVLPRMNRRDRVVVQVGITADFRRIAHTARQHPWEIAGLDMPVGVLVDVLGAAAGADPVAQEERDVVAPAELRIGLQAERLERRAQLQAG